jgi:hypothetical protein
MKVPVSFINKHKDKFHKIGDKIDGYSFAQMELFQEIRGEGETRIQPIYKKINDS